MPSGKVARRLRKEAAAAAPVLTDSTPKKEVTDLEGGHLVQFKQGIRAVNRKTFRRIQQANERARRKGRL